MHKEGNNMKNELHNMKQYKLCKILIFYDDNNYFKRLKFVRFIINTLLLHLVKSHQKKKKKFREQKKKN
jgi:hypothetical protein